VPRRRPDPRQLTLFPGGLLPAIEGTVEEQESPVEGATGRVTVVAAARQRISPAAAGAAFLRLDQALGGRLESLTLTANRSTLLSTRVTPGGGLTLRAHWSLALAPEEMVPQVALLASRAGPAARRAAARESVRSFIARHQPATAIEEGAACPGRAAPLRHRGRHHDLEEILGELNQRFFHPPVEVEITWGRAAARSRRRTRTRTSRTLRLGSYDSRTRRIRIHPCLDGLWVPRYVVASIVHHEMLHAVIPPEVRPGRRRLVHPPELRRREHEHPDFARAEEWLRRNLGRLLRR
jgi:hypothetical protein